MTPQLLSIRCYDRFTNLPFKRMESLSLFLRKYVRQVPLVL